MSTSIPEPRLVFVVDDEDALRETMARKLALDGWEVLPFETPVPALEELERRLPSVVVSDLHMPGMSGLEFLKRLRAARGPDVPQFIVVTAFGDLSSAREAIRGGAYEFLTKPFALEDLGRAVERAARLVRLERARTALLEMVAGDLRLPLGAIRMNLEALSEAGPLTRDQGELLQLAHQACRKAHLLAQSLDDLRLLERHQLFCRRERVDAEDAWWRALRQLDAELRPEGSPARPLWVLGDRDLLTRALASLFEAAEKPPLVSWPSPEDASARIAISRFPPRVLAAARDDWSAAGLPLAFAAAAIEAQRGKLTFEEAPGGARAVITLEKAPS